MRKGSEQLAAAAGSTILKPLPKPRFDPNDKPFYPEDHPSYER